MNEPGLISRVADAEHGEFVCVRERWNVREDGCPILVLRDGKPDPSAAEVWNLRIMRKEEWAKLRSANS